MAGQASDPVGLVQAILPVVLEVLASFNTQYEPSSKQTKQSRISNDFRIRTENQIKVLDLALRAPAKGPFADDGIAAAHGLLRLVNEQLIVCVDGPDKGSQEQAENDGRSDSYTRLEGLLRRERQAPRGGQERISWLQQRIPLDIENVSDQARTELPLSLDAFYHAVQANKADDPQSLEDLVRAILPAICDVASTLIASSVRNGIQRSRERLLENLTCLEDALHYSRKAAPSGDERLAAAELLYFLEETHIIAYDDSTSTDDEIPENDSTSHQPCAKYANILCLSRRLDSASKHEAKGMDWLKDLILLKQMPPKTLERLCARLEAYTRAVSQSSQRAETAFEQGSEGWKSWVREWTSVGSIFKGLEGSAKELKKHWLLQACTCSMQPADTFVSPHFPTLPDPGGMSCWLIYRFRSSDDTWRASRLVSKPSVPKDPDLVLSTEKKDHSPCDSSTVGQHGLCDHFEYEPDTIHISCTPSELHEHQTKPNRVTPSLKRRLILALRLAYAYLHLNDGPLWHKHSLNIWLTDWLATDQQIFLLHTDDETLADPTDIAHDMNEVMASLPTLGKALLEIVTGRMVSWDEFRREVAQLKQDEDFQHGIDVHNSIKSCLDESFKNSGTIRQHEHLKMRFLSKVVLELQYVLETGFRINVDEVFKTPLTEVAQKGNSGDAVSTHNSLKNLLQRSEARANNVSQKYCGKRPAAHADEMACAESDHDESRPHDGRRTTSPKELDVAGGASMSSIPFGLQQRYSENQAGGQARAMYGNVFVQGNYIEQPPDYGSANR